MNKVKEMINELNILFENIEVIKEIDAINKNNVNIVVNSVVKCMIENENEERNNKIKSINLEYDNKIKEIERLETEVTSDTNH